MNRYEAIAENLKSETGCTFIKTDHKESASRIVRRAMSKGWWFVAFQIGGEWHIAFAVSIDLEKDLRAKLSNLKFELD